LQHVAIDPDRARPELFEIHDRSKRPPNQPLNLHTAAVYAPFRNVASFTWLSRIWKHRILGSEPTAGHSLLFHPARHCLFDRDGTDHARGRCFVASGELSYSPERFFTSAQEKEIAAALRQVPNGTLVDVGALLGAKYAIGLLRIFRKTYPDRISPNSQ
jgi:hypothetical protein